MKKKPYWIVVVSNEVALIARNGVPTMFSSIYDTKREANQMAKRLAENLGLTFKREETK